MRMFKLILISAVLTFAFVLPTLSAATSSTVDRQACQKYVATPSSTTTEYWCGLHGGSWLATGLTKAYFDFSVTGTQIIGIRRDSYTGSVSSDSTTVTGGGDWPLTAVNTRATPSEWDYIALYLMAFPNSGTFWGVAAVN